MKTPLFRGMLLKALAVNVLFLPLFVFYVLWEPRVLDWRMGWPALLVLAHSWTIAAALFHFRSHLGFPHNSAHPHEPLWKPLALAGIMAAFAVWLPAALCIWTPARSMAQDHFYHSPLFPVMSPLEWTAPLVWLAGYAAILPAFLYARVRAGHTTGRSNGGWYVSGMVALAGLNVLSQEGLPRWFGWVELGFATVVIATFLVAGSVAFPEVEAETAEDRRKTLRIRWKPNPTGATAVFPQSTERDAICRRAEAIVLAFSSLLIVMMTAFRQGSACILPGADGVPGSVNQAALWLAAIGVGSILCAVALVVNQVTGAGVLLALTALFVCSLLSAEIRNNPGDQSGRRNLQRWQVFTLANSNVTGAELWINGVDVGKMPVLLSEEEFDRRVPVWMKPPDGLTTHKDAVRLYNGSWFDPNPDGKGVLYDTWTKEETVNHPTLYFRVRLGNEWGIEGALALNEDTDGSYSPYGSYSANNAAINYHTLRLSFPERDERLRRLLNKARLMNYSVDSAWCKALESYGPDGWLTLQKAAAHDPLLLKALDGWTEERYHIAGVTTPQAAWNKFQLICDEAEGGNSYFSGSPAGRAVERLAPLLNPMRLVDSGEKLLPHGVPTTDWVIWDLNGLRMFGRSRRPEGFYPGTHQLISQGMSDTPEWILPAVGETNLYEPTPMSLYPVAHALWTLYKDPARSGSAEGKRVKERIAADLIRWGSGDSLALQIAAALGGLDIDRFLLRNYEQVGRKGTNVYPDKQSCLILLAGLHDAAGRRFRREHLQEYMALAERGWSNDSFGMGDFLFQNLNEGQDSLAAHYWPLLLSHRPHTPDFALADRWKYLVKMEPLSTVSMYVDAWRASRFSYSEVIQLPLKLHTLPESKRQAIFTAIIHEAQKAIANLSDAHRTADLKNAVIDNLKGAILGWDEFAMSSLMNPLEDPEENGRREGMAKWLEHTRPDHPLVEKLASSHDPKLRVLVMGALQNDTNPARRAILYHLLHDMAANVRSAAQKAQRNIEGLTALPAGALAQG